jgi:hypothetical protein
MRFCVEAHPLKTKAAAPARVADRKILGKLFIISTPSSLRYASVITPSPATVNAF